MNKFMGLLAENVRVSPDEQQLYAQDHLPTIVASSNLNMWKPGDPFPQKGRRLLIGIAVYSTVDLCLLDALNEMLTSNGLDSDHFDVFSVLNCRTMSDFDNYVPTIGMVFQTPVVGVWEDGVLMERASGTAARELLCEIYPMLKKIRQCA